MARDPPLLTSTSPTTVVPAEVFIGHVQLRDLIICPRERGIVNYVQLHSIVEHNLNRPGSKPRTLADLRFTPNALASLQVPGTDHTLLAAGGQEAEIHLSLHPRHSSRHRRSASLWRLEDQLHASINNSVLLTSLSLTRSNESSAEPRVGISNNDCTVKFFDVPIRTQIPPKLKEIGCVRLNVPVNHSSISPDGRTLLSVGDSSKVYLHHLTGGARINFSPIATLNLPPPDHSPLPSSSSSLAASFSTSFSSDGTKYAVASQEGIVAVWDVRSSKPLKVFQTDKTRVPSGNGSGNGWLSDDPWEWTRGNSKAPGWSVRNVKFGSGGCNGSGKEIMSFTEHTSILHVVDARTFETEEIINIPTVAAQPRPRPPPPQAHPVSRNRRSASRTHPSLPRHVTPMTTASRLHPPTPPYIVLALEDTFRIPSSPPLESSSTRWRRRGGGPDMRPSSAIPEDDDDLLVIPPLGDRDVENDVQALLGHHGIRARHSEGGYRDGITNAGPGGIGGEYEDDNVEFVYGMDVDELESDCASSHTPSRASSPSPSVHVGVGTRVNSSSFSPPGREGRERPMRRWFVEEDGEMEQGDLDGDLDLAGSCFDPTGAHIYVASTECVAEWSVQGSEKRWWSDNEWL